MHVVGPQGGPDRLGDLRPGQPDVEADGPGALPQPVEMIFQEDQPVVVQAQALPHPVTDQKAAVKDRDPGLLARDERAVDVDQDVRIAFIAQSVVGAAIGHRSPSLPSGQLEGLAI